MTFFRRLFGRIKLWRQIDSSSLRVNLTVGIAAVSAIGLGSVAIWTSLRMQHILISTQKENVRYIADRFPHDVEIYIEMVSLRAAVQRAIDNLTSGNTVLWVKAPDGEIIARSAALAVDSNESALLSVSHVPPYLEVEVVNGRSWLLCVASLEVDGANLGRFYIARDVTNDQIMFSDLILNLSIASLIAIVCMTVAIALYIRKSLQPLHKISQLTQMISAERLGEAHIQLENAPSEVRELAQTVDSMLVRLSEAWEHQRQLVSNVSHELRTPLTIVSGYLQSTLRRGDNLTETQRESLEMSASEAQRTIQLLQDLLDLARAESGRMHLTLQPLEINQIVAEVAQAAKQYSDRPIKVEISPHPIWVKVDGNRLKQVLLNLVDNAVKYSDLQPITVKLAEADKTAIVQVCDRGVGIALAQQARIFERFYRVDEARNRAGGTGLGLSIVKVLVEGMGGTVAVRSQLGEGSTFTVTFPTVNRL
ncbi:MAG: sensor histidine kinase [Cyanophyceae cyanobacterium]